VPFIEHHRPRHEIDGERSGPHHRVLVNGLVIAAQRCFAARGEYYYYIILVAYRSFCMKARQLLHSLRRIQAKPRHHCESSHCRAFGAGKPCGWRRNRYNYAAARRPPRESDLSLRCPTASYPSRPSAVAAGSAQESHSRRSKSAPVRKLERVGRSEPVISRHRRPLRVFLAEGQQATASSHNSKHQGASRRDAPLGRTRACRAVEAARVLRCEARKQNPRRPGFRS
jgi:hypothetical protein